MNENRPGAPPWAAGVFLASLGLYLWQLAPGVFWLDSSEFVACARAASIPHPPGTPGYVVLAHLANLLPLGSVAFRVNLLSAVLGAGAMAALFLAARTLLARVRTPGILTDATMALLVLALALSRAAWFQAIRAEVYTLDYLVSAVAVLLALRWDAAPTSRTGHVLLVALVLGVGLSNHHYLVILTLPAFIALLLSRTEGRAWLAPRRIGPLLGLAAAGLLLYLFLPLRNRAGADLAWGDTTSPGGFLGVVSARAFHLSITEMPRAPFLDACTTILESWVGLLGPVLFFAGLLGLAAWVWRAPRIGGFLALLMAAGVISKAIMYLDVENPDDHGYFFVGLQALTLAATGLVLPIEALVRRFFTKKTAATIAAATALLVGAGAVAGSAATFESERRELGLRDFHAPDALHRAFLGDLPPDAVLMPSYYAIFFNHVYHRGVEQRRPDVALLHQSFFRRIEDGAPYASLIRRGHPDLAPVVDEHHATGFFPWDALLAVATRRPVILEVDVLELGEDDPARDAVSLGKGGLDLPWDHTRFIGPGLRLRPRGAPLRSGETARAAARFWQRFYKSLAGDRGHAEARKILLWIHYRDALYFARTGQWEEAGLETGLALRLAPDQARLQALQALVESHHPSTVKNLHTP